MHVIKCEIRTHRPAGPDGSAFFVQIDATPASLTVGAPQHVFDDPYMRDVSGGQGGMAYYDIAPSGQSFVMVEDLSSAGDRADRRMQFHLVLNWFEELKQRMGN